MALELLVLSVKNLDFDSRFPWGGGGPRPLVNAKISKLKYARKLPDLQYLPGIEHSADDCSLDLTKPIVTDRPPGGVPANLNPAL